MNLSKHSLLFYLGLRSMKQMPVAQGKQCVKTFLGTRLFDHRLHNEQSKMGMAKRWRKYHMAWHGTARHGPALHYTKYGK